MPEIVIKADDPVHFGFGNIERFGDHGNRSLVHIAEFLLQCMQNRQKSARKLLQFLDEGGSSEGSETIVIVRLGEREVLARFEPDEAPAVGHRVTLAIDMAKACLFDPESERLI